MDEAEGVLFDITALAATMPGDTKALIVDHRLIDRPGAGVRMFRVNRPVPRHYHARCDEHLLVVSGRARFAVGGLDPVELGPGRLVFFERGTPHEIPAILEEPFVVLAFEVPARDPADIHWVGEGSADPFLETRH